MSSTLFSKDLPWLSVILPTYRRPALLRRCLASLAVGGAVPFGVEVLVGFQDDDETAIPDEVNAIPGMRALMIPEQVTLAEKVNAIAREARGDFLMSWADDMVIGDRLWPQTVVTALANTPHPGALNYALYPPNPDMTILPIVPRGWMAVTGWLAAPWFPYWFTDTWWDEIATMVCGRCPVDIGVSQPHGNLTSGQPDLLLWVHLFTRLRPLRIAQAQRIAGLWSIPWQRVAECEQRVAHLYERRFLDAWGTDAPRGGRYAEAKAAAEAILNGGPPR